MIKGLPTCVDPQVTSTSGEEGSVVRNNSLNAWNVNMDNGNVNTNNTWNRNSLSESPSLESAKRLMASVNSYFGMMRKCAAYNIMMRISGMVLDKFGTWLFFAGKG